MKPENKKEFILLMAMLAEAFKDPVSSERAKIYFEFLEKYPLYLITWGVKRAIRELKFFPKISELIELMGDHHGWGSGPSLEYLVEGEKKEEIQAIEYIKRMANLIGGPEKTENL